MAALAENPRSAKMLLIGNSGMGKTGALVSLAKAGYKLRVVDTDNGTEILQQLLADNPAATARVDVETHMDKYSNQGGVMRASTPLAGFSGAAKVMTDWPGHGKPSSWGDDTILVLDTVTGLGRAVMNHALALSGKLATGQLPTQPDWGVAMGMQEQVIAGLSALPCHVIVIAHIVNIQPEGSPVSEGFPSVLGNKLPQKIASYFNHTIAIKALGSGSVKVRTIVTKDPTLGCKTPAPGKVKDTYPLETGLADYFQDCFGPVKAA